MKKDDNDILTKGLLAPAVVSLSVCTILCSHGPLCHCPNLLFSIYQTVIFAGLYSLHYRALPHDKAFAMDFQQSDILVGLKPKGSNRNRGRWWAWIRKIAYFELNDYFSFCLGLLPLLWRQGIMTIHSMVAHLYSVWISLYQGKVSSQYNEASYIHIGNLERGVIEMRDLWWKSTANTLWLGELYNIVKHKPMKEVGLW